MTKFNYKNIAIYYPSLEYFGGIESVIIQQLKIFSNAGFKCYMITDIPISRCKDQIYVDKIVIAQDPKRNENFQRELKNNNIDVVLMNGAAFPSTSSDICAIHNAGAKVVLTIHFSFPSPIIFNEAWDCYKINREIGLKCDAVVTVSKADAKWWKALGCNAFYVQNPFNVKTETHKEKPNNDIIVWVGRAVESKQMYEAFKIISYVKSKIPDIVLRMIGPDITPSIKKILKKLNIESNVQFYPNEKNVGQHYAAAKVHLLTSITESFCLVIAEAKSYSIPTVMYSIPFLELARDGKGIIEVEQRDSTSAAAEIIKLLNDDTYRTKLGNNAKETLKDFNDDSVISGWHTVFKNLENNTRNTELDHDECDIFIKQIFDAWEYQRCKNQFKIDFFKEFDKITHNKGRNIINVFMHFIVKPIKYIKRKIR